MRSLFVGCFVFFTCLLANLVSAAELCYVPPYRPEPCCPQPCCPDPCCIPCCPDPCICAPPCPEILCCFNAPCCWTGLYVGVHGGFGGALCLRTKFNSIPDEVSVNVRNRTLHSNVSGGFGGIQVGYNFEWCCFRTVLGIEADISGSNIRGKKEGSLQLVSGPVPEGSFITTERITKWFGTIRPRIGYVGPCNLLIYLTGGLAYSGSRYKADTNFASANQRFPASFCRTTLGWTIGGGFEHGFFCKWSLKAEYLYSNFGRISRTVDGVPPTPPSQIRYTFDTQNHILRLGLNYRICWCD